MVPGTARPNAPLPVPPPRGGRGPGGTGLRDSASLARCGSFSKALAAPPSPPSRGRDGEGGAKRKRSSPHLPRPSPGRHPSPKETRMSDIVRSTLTTCPYCGTGLRREGRRPCRRSGDGFRRSGSSGELRPPLRQGLGAGRDPDRRRAVLLHPVIDGARASWDDALDRIAGTFRAAIDEHGPDSVALYLSGQILTEGLLRRQQADEGLRRLRQRRHQLAALHGLVGRRPQARLRHRHRAADLRGPREGRSRRPRRLEPRLVPPGASPAPRRRQGRAPEPARRHHRPTSHRDERDRRSPSGPRARQRRRPLRRPPPCAGSAPASATPPSSPTTRTASRRPLDAAAPFASIAESPASPA